MTKPAGEPTPPKISLPSLGRIVYYCDSFMGDEYPAIVTAVYGQTDVALTAFQVGQNPNAILGATKFNSTDKPVKGQWRWPPQE